MKNKIVVLMVFFFSLATAYSQPDGWRKGDMKDRFEQLEKIKVIETLGMDEETTLRFFSRRAEHEKDQDQIQQQIKSNIEDLDVIFKSGRVATIEEIKTKINKINDLHVKLASNRKEFINSLSDILSYEQMAKLLVFERKFRDEIRRLLIKDRRPPIEHE